MITRKSVFLQDSLVVCAAAILFVWLMTFVFMVFSLSWVPRFAELLILSIAVVGFFWGGRFISIPAFIFVVFLMILIVLSYVFDQPALYSKELYLKTLYYLVLCSLGGVVYSRILFFGDNYILACKVLAWLAVITIFSLFFGLYYFIGWRLGGTLIGTEFGEYYQGLSRAIAMCVLLIVCVRVYLPVALVLVSLFVSVFLILGFNSMGALLGFFVSFLYYICSVARAGFFRFSISFSFVLLVLAVAFFSVNLDETPVVARFLERLAEKFHSSAASSGENRLWLMLQGLSLWFDNLLYFFRGAGPMTYACEVGYCDSYRHPHNLFVMLAVWFGLLSFPISFAVIYLFFKAVGVILRQGYGSVIAAIFMYLFLLSLIGGDIEQNRHLIFFSFALWGISTNRSRSLAGDINRVR